MSILVDHCVCLSFGEEVPGEKVSFEKGNFLTFLF